MCVSEDVCVSVRMCVCVSEDVCVSVRMCVCVSKDVCVCQCCFSIGLCF